VQTVFNGHLFLVAKSHERKNMIIQVLILLWAIFNAGDALRVDPYCK
jgi:steroid 5-alpha reductase family enzyme